MGLVQKMAKLTPRLSMTPRTVPTIDKLRELGKNSCNVHLASPYSLRWHDPVWLASWERWQKARNTWRRTMLEVPFALLNGFEPKNIEGMEPEAAAVAREFQEAREDYLQWTHAYVAADDEYEACLNKWHETLKTGRAAS